MQLLTQLKKCNFIVGIHLNNNGTALNANHFQQVMKLFDIREADLVACNRSKVAEAKGESPVTGQSIDYYQYLRPYFTLASPDA